MKYAVVRINKNQFKVKEGETFLVDKLVGKPSAEVLLVADGDTVVVGKPIVAKATVTLKVETAELKGEKVRINKFVAKSRYRKTLGFRAIHTKLKVDSISLGIKK